MRFQRSLLRDSIVSLFGQTSGYVATILIGIVIARQLGPAGKGIVALAGMALSIFTTLANGLQAAILYECGRNRRPLPEVLAGTLRWGALLAVPGVIGLAAAAVAAGRDGGVGYAVAAAVPFAIFLQLANAVFLLTDDVPSTIAVGAVTTFGFAFAAALILLVAHGGTDAVLIAWSAMYVLSGLLALWRLRGRVPANVFRIAPAGWREQGWYALKTGGINLADFLNLRVDVFIVGAMLGARELGIYSLGVATGEMMWQLSRPVAWSSLGRIAASSRSGSIVLVATITRNILLLESALGILAWFVAPAAIRFVYGSAFAGSGEVVRWLLPGLVAYATHGALGYFVTVKDGRPALVLGVQSAAIALCAAISVLAIPRLGLPGAALATTVTYLFSTAFKAGLFLRAARISPRALVVPRRRDFQRAQRALRSFARVAHITAS